MSESTLPAVGIPEEYKPIEDGITLYTLGTPNGVKISLALSLLNIPYKAYTIDISTNIQKKEWFLQNVNLNGRIPSIIDNTEGKGTKVFESGAILFYLTEKYDEDHVLSYPRGSPEYFETMEWLFFQNAGVGPMQGQANHFKLFAKEKIEYGITRYLDETRRLYSVLERRLIENKTGFLVGPHVSIADISTVGWVTVAYAIDIDVKSEYPALAEWVQRIIKLPGALDGFNTPTPYRAFTSRAWSTN
ncbi:hypothetical protein DV452_003620 [Geotrichum candidum]|nr:hypothetical protein DV452_003620 [Geotrichum candidum]